MFYVIESNLTGSSCLNLEVKILLEWPAVVFIPKPMPPAEKKNDKKIKIKIRRKKYYHIIGPKHLGEERYMYESIMRP